VKARQQRRESMDVDQSPTTPKIQASDDDKMDVDEEKKDDKENEDTPAAESSKKKAEKEKVGYDLENMSRVLPGQVKYISFPEERYVPVKKVSRSCDLEAISTNSKQPTGGVILVHDTTPSAPKSLLELKVKKAAPAAVPGASGDDAPAGVQAGPESEDVDDNLVEEGDAEAPKPGEFEYISDTGEGDDD
jgi:26S proteasome regulatory subunit N2